MKRFYLLLFVLMLLPLTAANAKSGGFAIKGGLTYSNVSGFSDIISGKYTFKNYTGWQAGVGYQSPTLLGFSIHPELVYKNEGFKVNNSTFKMGYIDIPVNLQWGPDLLIFRPYVMVTPFIGFNVTNAITNTEINLDVLRNAVNRVEGGIGVGGGLDVWKIQLMARYFWNFGEVSEIKINEIETLSLSKSLFEFTIGFVF